MSAMERLWEATEHPATEGLAGCVALLAAFLAPIVAGLVVVETALGVGTTGAYALGAVGAFGGVWAFNRVLWHTIVHDWIANFREFIELTDIGSMGGGERA